MSTQLREAVGDLDVAGLKTLLLEMVRVLPEARDVVVQHLDAARNQNLHRRSVSVSDMMRVPITSELAAPLKNEDGTLVKVAKGKVNGHDFKLHNFFMSTPCCQCNKALRGLFRQGYQCRRCLLTAHAHCLANLSPCVNRPLSKKSRRRLCQTQQRLGAPSTLCSDTAAAHGAALPQPSTAAYEGAPQRDKHQQDTHTHVEIRPAGGNGEEQEKGKETKEEEEHRGNKAGVTAAAADEEEDDDDTDNDDDKEEEEEGDYYEENSTDGDTDTEVRGSDEGDDAEGQSEHAQSKSTKPIDRTISLPHNQLRCSLRLQDVQLPTRHRTGCKEDWKKHSASFRARLSTTRQLTAVTIEMALKGLAALEKEFDNIPQNRVNIVTMPRLTEQKNRYLNILPNNHSRVLLGDADADDSYINANWMSGYKHRPETYIAAQGPMSTTVDDMWRMIWVNAVSAIVMNTGLQECGVEKCVRYWPTGVGSSQTYAGDIFVTVTAEHRPRKEFMVTEMELACDGQVRLLTHLWWDTWPDKGVPESTNAIGALVLAARAACRSADHPLLVHCSAGVGRTGCFLAIDIGMQQFDEHGWVDILACVGRLRKDRGMTVQTFSQYVFIHQVLQRYMHGNLLEDLPEPAAATTDDVKDVVLLNVNTRVHFPAAAAAVIPQDIAAEPPYAGGELTIATKPSTAAPTAQVKGVKFRLLPKEDQASGSPSGSGLARRCSSDPNEDVVSHGQHNFRYKTFTLATYCIICGQLLQGLARQGLRCSCCKNNVHASCLHALDEACQLASSISRMKSGLPSWPPNRPS